MHNRMVHQRFEALKRVKELEENLRTELAMKTQYIRGIAIKDDTISNLSDENNALKAEIQTLKKTMDEDNAEITRLVTIVMELTDGQ